MLALTACAKTPINLETGYTAPFNASWTSPHHRKASAPEANLCRVHLGDIADKRSNTQGMGMMGNRLVLSADPAAWLRSGLQTLNRDADIQIVDDSAQGDLDLSADLLKAYVLLITSDKSTTVVIRAHYSRNGSALGDQVYRGVSTGWNWANGADETQSSFDDALDDLLKTVDADIETRCKSTMAAAANPPDSAKISAAP